MVTENVFARVPLVTLEQQIIQPFSQGNITKLLESQDRSTHTACRNYALFLFCWTRAFVHRSAFLSGKMMWTGNMDGCACSTGRARSSAGWA